MSCKLRDTTRDPSTGQGTRSSDTFQERHAGGLHQCNPSYEASVDDGVGEKRKEDNGQNNDRIWGSQSSLLAPNDDSCFFWLLVRLRPTGRGDQNIYQAKKIIYRKHIAQVRGHLQPSNSTCNSAHVHLPFPINLGFGYRAERFHLS